MITDTRTKGRKRPLLSCKCGGQRQVGGGKSKDNDHDIGVKVEDPIPSTSASLNPNLEMPFTLPEDVQREDSTDDTEVDLSTSPENEEVHCYMLNTT